MTAAHDRSETTGRTARSPADIESDIRAIRSRMDRTLDEIEYRLSPGQLSGGMVDLVRDVVQGNPNRTARAIRENPVPVALIGIGVLWLAWAVSRTPALDGHAYAAEDALISDQRARSVLGALVTATRQGAEGCREADIAIADTALGPRLREIAAQLDRAAAALEGELYRLDGALDPTGPVHPAWGGLRESLDLGSGRQRVLSALEHGIEATLNDFRGALAEDLPDHLRVVIGAHFHELEQVQHRIDALRESVA